MKNDAPSAAAIEGEANSDAQAAQPRTAPAHEIHIARATYADLPALAEAELLAFANEETLGPLLAPHRPTLLAAGTPPREWPDYRATMRRRARMLASHGMALVAHAGGRPVGFAFVSFTPRRARAGRSWTDWFYGDVLYPALDKLGLGGAFEEMDGDFFALVIAAVVKNRKEAMGDAPYVALELLFVHPSVQGTGVGSALIARAAAIADAANLPLVLEASVSGRPLYARRGFVPMAGHVCTLEYNGTHVKMPFMVRKLPGGLSPQA